MDNHSVSELLNELQGLDTQAVVDAVLDRFGKEIVLASSLGIEDQVLTHMVLQKYPDTTIAVLDTGRLPTETYDLMDAMSQKYGFRYDVYFPDYRKVEIMVREGGVNLFYNSIENRKLCCHIRKVEPLQRALKGEKAWITGIRKSQATSRATARLVEWDDTYQLIKFNPLIDWSESQVMDYLKTHQVPYNKLYDQGYLSIGCAPCTRAVKPGEDSRSGRWWWENSDTKECGLHWKDGKLVRAKK